MSDTELRDVYLNKLTKYEAALEEIASDGPSLNRGKLKKIARKALGEITSQIAAHHMYQAAHMAQNLHEQEKDMDAGKTVKVCNVEVLDDLLKLVGFINDLPMSIKNISKNHGGGCLATLDAMAKGLSDKYGFAEKKSEKCCGTCGQWACFAEIAKSGDEGYCDAKKSLEMAFVLPFWVGSPLTHRDEGKDCKCWKGKD